MLNTACNFNILTVLTIFYLNWKLFFAENIWSIHFLKGFNNNDHSKIFCRRQSTSWSLNNLKMVWVYVVCIRHLTCIVNCKGLTETKGRFLSFSENKCEVANDIFREQNEVIFSFSFLHHFINTLAGCIPMLSRDVRFTLRSSWWSCSWCHEGCNRICPFGAMCSLPRAELSTVGPRYRAVIVRVFDEDNNDTLHDVHTRKRDKQCFNA